MSMFLYVPDETTKFIIDRLAAIETSVFSLKRKDLPY